MLCLQFALGSWNYVGWKNVKLAGFIRGTKELTRSFFLLGLTAARIQILKRKARKETRDDDHRSRADRSVYTAEASPER